jgi:hypothetical protein
VVSRGAVGRRLSAAADGGVDVEVALNETAAARL